MHCRLCHKPCVIELLDFGPQPIVHNLMRQKNEPYPQFDFCLGVCMNCGFLQILKPILPEILYREYFTLSSWKNQPHVPHLLWLIENICGCNSSTSILEIGCNDGSLLDFFKLKGSTRAITRSFALFNIRISCLSANPLFGCRSPGAHQDRIQLSCPAGSEISSSFKKVVS